MAVSCAKYPPDDRESDNAISRILELRNGKKRWDPDSYDEFLDNRYGDFENSDEYDELERFIDETWDLDPKNLSDATGKEDSIAAVFYTFASGRDWQSAVNAFTCTGGQYRSVYFAERMAKRLDVLDGVEVAVVHSARPYWKTESGGNNQ